MLDPRTSELCDQFAEQYAELRKHKGVTVEQARETIHDVSYFGTMLVHNDMVDGMVSGAMHTTAHTVRPAFEIIKTLPGISTVSSIFLMCLADRVLAYGDCAIVPDPTSEQLADIAISSARTAAQFGIEPRVAMLSYSTGTSGTGADVDKVRAATELVREREPDLLVDGPIQYDAAVDPTTAADQDARLEGGGQGDGADLPGPQHRQQHLQGRAAQRGRDRDRSGAAGTEETGQRPVPRRAGRGHRQHRGDHRDPGAGAVTAVLVLNSGSSSVKYAVVEPDSGVMTADGIVERIGEGEVADHAAAMQVVFDELSDHMDGLVAVGHRVVHGGPDLYRPTLIDDALIAKVEELAPLAPLHNPPAVLGIKVAREALPDLPHIAVFDTAFFHDLPPAAATYAIDRDIARQWHIRRYGFHGTSHQYVSEQAAAFLGRAAGSLNQIVLHLGNGASASAIAGGRPVDTSMGLTPMEGLVMGTRSGDIDPGIVIVSVAHRGDERRGHRDDAQQALRGARPRRRDRLPGACTSASNRATPQHNWPTTSTSTGCASTSARTWRCWATPTSSPSPRGSARTMRPSAAMRWPGWPPWASSSTSSSTTAATKAARRISSDESRTTVLVVPTDEELAIARACVDVIEEFSARAGLCTSVLLASRSAIRMSKNVMNSPHQYIHLSVGSGCEAK